MKLYTSYFAKVKDLKKMGFSNLVCVAGYAPKFFFEVDDARFYPDLAPRKPWFWEWKNKHLSNEWYIERYNETVLNTLNIDDVLHDLGEDAVMLCYEKPGDFCHRHLIADWMKKERGVEVEEVVFTV